MRGDLKTAIVTGGNRGIGRAIAKSLAAKKMNLLIAALGQRENRWLARELENEYGVMVETIDADLTLEKNCVAAVETAVSRFGRLDLLVNNVGVWSLGRIVDSQTKAFDHVMRTNLFSTFWCSREAYRAMLANDSSERNGVRGSIVNISSICGIQGRPSVGLYAASKHAVVGLTRAMAEEGAMDGIRAASICPGLVATPSNRFSGSRFIQMRDITQSIEYLMSLSGAAWPVELVLKRRKKS